MTFKLVTKTFVGNDQAALETEVNAFLAPLKTRDVIDVGFGVAVGGKTGENVTFTAFVVYKELVS